MAETVLTKVRLDLKAALREGIDYWRAGEFDKALVHFKAIRRFFDESEPVYLRQYYCDLGLVHRGLGQNERAIEEYRNALSIEPTSEHEESDVTAVHANMAYALLALNRPQEALAYLKQPEEFFRKRYESFHLGEVLETQAKAYLALNEPLKALKAAKEAVDILHDCGDSQAANRAIRTLQQAREACERNGVFKT